MLVDCPKLTSLECSRNDLSTLNTNQTGPLNINSHVLKRIKFRIEEYFDAFALSETFPELEIMHLEIYPMVSHKVFFTWKSVLYFFYFAFLFCFFILFFEL
jgi:hypothetical protein